jgi:UDP-glucose 4-epimerase
MTLIKALFGIDVVIHCAGLKSVPKSITNPLSYYDNNVSGTLSLLSAMNQVGTKRIIFSSSATVYGIPKLVPISEMHPTNPTTPYGRSKLMVEEMLNDMTDLNVTTLRYFNPVGAHESGLLGDNPREVNNLFPVILNTYMGKQDVIPITGDDYDTPDGTGIRDYIHIMDVASAHSAVLTCMGHNTYNIGTGIGYSVHEIISQFELQLDEPLMTLTTHRRPGDIPICICSPTKIFYELGWRYKYELEDMVSSTINFAHKNEEIQS